MTIKKLKILSVTAFCFAAAVWSEIQCMDHQTQETGQNLPRQEQIATMRNNAQAETAELRRARVDPMAEARAWLIDAKLGVDWWRNKSMNTGAAIAFVSIYTSINYYDYGIFSSLIIAAPLGIISEETLYWLSGCGRSYGEALSSYYQTRGLNKIDDEEFLRSVQIHRLDHSLIR